MSTVHAWVGTAIMLTLLGLAVWGLVLRLLGRDEAPGAFWIVQHYTENVLILQVVLGIALLLIGRRVAGPALVWLHYLYGSLFPLIAIVAGRIAGLRREHRDYVGLAWGAFFAFGLTTRALMTGCGDALGSLGRCLGFG